MRVRIAAAAVFFLLALIAPGEVWASDLVVSLPPSVEARDGWFYLGEYAEIGGPAELADSASMAVIRHGGRFSRGDVLEALSATTAAGSSVAITMPDFVEVRPESGLVSALRDAAAWQWRIGVEIIPGTWDELISGYSGYSLPPKITPGARTIAVKLDSGGGRQSTKQVKLTWYQPMVYSLRPLQKGGAVDASALGGRIGKAAMMMTNFSSPEQLAGAVTRRPVGAMEPIETGDISQDGFVRAGTAVTMVANVNGLGVEVRGIAMQRGGMGDIIKVKNLSSKKVLRARIIGPERVEINP